MISIREEVAIAAPPDAVWPLLSDPATVASCIPGATLTRAGDGGAYQGAMRVKFGPTVAQFRGEAKLAYDHAARRCTIEGRGIDGRGASRANASGVVEATGGTTTLLKVEGNFTVTGPLETFANAGGVHLARAILVEFADNVGKLATERVAAAAPGELSPGPTEEKAADAATDIVSARRSMTEAGNYGDTTAPAPPQAVGGRSGHSAPTAAPPRPAAAELSGGKILWRAFLSWLRQVFARKKEIE